MSIDQLKEPFSKGFTEKLNDVAYSLAECDINMLDRVAIACKYIDILKPFLLDVLSQRKSDVSALLQQLERERDKAIAQYEVYKEERDEDRKAYDESIKSYEGKIEAIQKILLKPLKNQSPKRFGFVL